MTCNKCQLPQLSECLQRITGLLRGWQSGTQRSFKNENVNGVNQNKTFWKPRHRFTHRCRDYSLTATSCHLVLQLRLQQRRTQELANQGIAPPLKSPTEFHEQRKHLDSDKTEDALRHKVRNRPDRADVGNMHVLQASTAERSIPTAQMKLKRARLADDLNEKIALRPGPLELVEKNILPVDSAVKEAIKGNQVSFSKSADAFAFEEDSSSDGLSPDQARSEDPQGSAGSPADTKASESHLAGPPGAIQDHSSGSENDKNDSASQPSSQSDAGRPGLGTLGTSCAGHPAVKPPVELATMLSAEYSPALQGVTVPPRDGGEPNEQMVRNPNSTSTPLSNTPLSPVKNSFSGQTGVSSLKPGPLPSNLDDLKVSELRQQLRLRGLPVSGTKTALMDRLRPFQDCPGAAVPSFGDITTVTFPVTPGAALPGAYRFGSTSSSPPISPASSELSAAGSLPDAFADASPPLGLPQCSPQHSPLGAVKSPQHISLPPSPNCHYFLPPSSSGGAQGEGHRGASPVGGQGCSAQNSGAHEGHPPTFSPQPSSLHPPFSGTQADSSHGAGGNPCPQSPGIQQKVAGLHSSDKTGPKFSIPSPPFSKSTSAVPEITQPPSYEDAVKQQMTRSQQMDELLDVLIESGEMPADAREDHSCLQKVPKLPGSSRSPNAALPKPSSSGGQLSFDHYGTDSDEHLEVLLNSQSPLGKMGDVALLKLGSEEHPFEGIMDGFSGKPAEDLFSAHEILPGPLSPMQTQFSPSSADSNGLRLSFTESPWETMEWLDLTPPSSTPSFSSLGPSGPSIFNIDFLDVTDLNLNSPMDLHLQQW
ncbi:myocardin [Suricata suricatta]|uniref:myocardin n=1 Tax=Suricata suricatta TaxID=37032 RepID=UPI001156098C|nr:myocardin [Suricata suricatta]